MELPDRQREILTLTQEWDNCERCSLCSKRTQVVFGVGSLEAQLLFIGEGPGNEEDRAGIPFVGPSGEVLDLAIARAGLRRDLVRTTNVVKCIPRVGATRRVEPPTADQVAACLPSLQREINAIDPRVIVTLGKTALQILKGTSNLKMDTAAGRQFALRIPGKVLSEVEYTAIATYHPAWLLRNDGFRRVNGRLEPAHIEAEAWIDHIVQAARLARLPRSF